TDEMIARYSAINRKYWEALERGEMTKPRILVERFREFFSSEGLDPSIAEEFNSVYQHRLGDTIVFCDDSYSIVEELKGKVLQYAVSNGTVIAQSRKLSRSGLDRLFDDVFLSEQLGVEKPASEFFEKVFEKTGDLNKDQVIIVGDSLTSDMRGGNNAGIRTCWYNPKHLTNNTDVKVDWEISDLHDIFNILQYQD
ncbi:MAG: YjjG family noncanonical pyrimidine nucleotidase, partial [Parasporobacterium sp.]|nr:YjjG family noncanonical pyrimidine nucleotidase [Parasporobacterium sp.]